MWAVVAEGFSSGGLFEVPARRQETLEKLLVFQPLINVIGPWSVSEQEVTYTI